VLAPYFRFLNSIKRSIRRKLFGPFDRSVKDPRNIYTLITSLVMIVTYVGVFMGLLYVLITTRILWIQLLLSLLTILWALTIVQNVRLAVVAILSFLARLQLLPTDYLLAAQPLPMNALTMTILDADTIPANEIYSADMPKLPSLSVLIPVVNEDEHYIKRGVRSVKAVEYNGLIKIFLLDDSPDQRYKSLAEEMGIEYVARPEKIHGKAGNLNYALKNHVDTELVFVMDCDYEIVDPEIFIKMVSVMDEKTALVQAPQRYRNYYDSYASEFAEIENRIWFDTINLHSDRYGIVPYQGTNSIVRMNALREVGFLDEEASVDDFPTYARMLLQGWNTAYISDVVMEGYAPKDLPGLLKQRKKWATGMGKAFISVGYKLLGRGGLIPSIHHWCNFTWFAWPLTNLLYSFLLGIFVILEYLHIFTIPMLPILVLINLVTSLTLLFFLGGKLYWLSASYAILKVIARFLLSSYWHYALVNLSYCRHTSRRISPPVSHYYHTYRF